MGRPTFNLNDEWHCPFCALEYRPEDRCGVALPEGRIILVALETEVGDLRFLLDPKWRDIVPPADRDYIGKLCEDLKRRTRFDSASLFKKLTTLEVGPLVTRETGSSLSENPIIRELCQYFVEL